MSLKLFINPFQSMQSQQHPKHIASQKNWSFTQNDHKAEKIFSSIQQQARKDMPPTIYSPFVMTHYQEMRKHKLYSVMKTIPKGALHHCHIDCCEDKQYYRLFIINDPIIYLNQEMSEFRIGTQKQAQQSNWISMKTLKEKFHTEDELVDFLSNITMLNTQDNRKIAAKEIKFWQVFQKKIVSFFTILFTLHHFKKYMKYISEKFIKNGYDRLQWRSMISELVEYDQQGNVVQKHPQRKYIEVLDEVGNQLKQKYPNFSYGVIFFGLKMFNAEQNGEILTKVCELKWDKTLGFDFVQQQDAYGSLRDYDEVVNKVLLKYPHLNYKKVYHAGQTKDPMNNNIQIAVKAGSVRVGHGINILQRMQFLKECKNICFEINHISNILTGLRDDTRITSAPVLMSLGYALTINPDDPGKFGYEDATVDYFSSAISFNWGLKEFKLLAIHSINHAICQQEERQKLLKSFNQRWDDWINELISSN